jgi:hypothetical protein
VTSVFLACGVLACGGTAALAQAPTPVRVVPGPSTPSRTDADRAALLAARYHVRQMENVLEHAVQHAADMMRRRLHALTPDVLALAGAPRVQGFRIDGYGLFFSVEVPRLSESVNWALRVLTQDRDERVLASLQKLAADVQDPAVRADLEQAIRAMQMQLTGLQRASRPVSGATQRRASTSGSSIPVPLSASDGAGGAMREAAPSAPPVAGPAALPPGDSAPSPVQADDESPFEQFRDPSAAYEQEVKQALVDAVLDYAGSLPLGAAEWVTVAARDAGYVAFPDAVSDMVTVTLSVRVSDLVDFRAQRLTREQARARVILREF